MREPKTAKDIIYYSITFFKDPNKCGKTLENVYKTEAGALKKARSLKAEAPESLVIIRKEEVFYRNNNNEYSTSAVYKRI